VPWGVAKGTQVAESDIIAAAKVDKAKLSSTDASFVRYVSLHEVHNSGASAEELKIARVGLSKTLNSVARWAPKNMNPDASFFATLEQALTNGGAEPAGCEGQSNYGGSENIHTTATDKQITTWTETGASVGDAVRLNTGASCFGCHADGMNRFNNNMRDWLDAGILPTLWLNNWTKKFYKYATNTQSNN
jgi:hypothetical protein